MIKKLLGQAAGIDVSGFKLIEEIDGFVFYSKLEENSKRFLIVYETESLRNVDYYNNKIQEIVPNELKFEPAFERNSDFIILFKIENLSDFNKHEKYILSIEEDPYFFKKYVLYYSSEELDLVKDIDFSELKISIFNRDLFNKYKQNPNFPSIYSFAARFFIKLPFLQVPVSEEKMPSIEVMLDESLKNKNIFEFDKKLSLLIESKNSDLDDVIKEFENE
ncbi:MAG: hypothetical protein HRU38_17140 [Saccharospirillaceae bacterium]|nr:hypothetical protein [Saccharospirillaceae bacterium]